jgi:hypothetical protein
MDDIPSCIPCIMAVLDSSGNNGLNYRMGNEFRLFPEFGRKDNMFRTANSDENG